MKYFLPYKNHFIMMLYLVVFIIFFGLSVFLVTEGSSVKPSTVNAETQSP